MTDGTLLRGEVLARWQEFVGTGEFFRQVETTIARVARPPHRRRQGHAAAGRGSLGEALQTGVAALVVSNAEAATSETARAWRRLAGGGARPARHPDLAKPSADLGPDVERLVRDWQGDVLELVRSEGAGPPHQRAHRGLRGQRASGCSSCSSPSAAPAGSSAPRSASPAAPPSSPSASSRRSSATRRCATWPTKARARLLEMADELYAAERRALRRRPRRLGRPVRPGAQAVARARPGPGGGAVSPLRMGSARGAVVSPERLAAASDALSAAVDRRGRAAPRGRAASRRRRRRQGHRAHRPRRGPHRRRARRRHRQRQVLPLQRPRRRLTSPRSASAARPPRPPPPPSGATEPAGALLDWLGVGTRHLVDTAAEDADAQLGSLDGLVLLDLPDFDSREVANRDEAERVLELVDLFVWVTDPQKYADARLHDDYVAALVDPRGRDDRRPQPGRPAHRRPRSSSAAPTSCGSWSATACRAPPCSRRRSPTGARRRRAPAAPRERRRRPHRRPLAPRRRRADGRRRAHRPRRRRRRQGSSPAARAELLDALARSAGVPDRRRGGARATTGWRPSPPRAGRSPGGCSASRPGRCDACASTGATSGCPTPTCARCSAGPRCRRPRPPPAQRSTSRPAGSPTGPRAGLPDAVGRGRRARRDPAGRGARRRPRPGGRRHLALRPVTRVVAGRSGRSSCSSPPTAVAGLLWLALYVVLGWLQLDRIVGEPPTLGGAAGAGRPARRRPARRGAPRRDRRAGSRGIGARRRGRVMDRRLRDSIEVVAQERIVAAGRAGARAPRGDP